MMKKTKLLVIPLALSLLSLTACAGKVNQGPEISGAKDLTCLAGATVDLLDGVAALDYEDGDITPDLKITANPEITVTDGYAVFPSAGVYNVTYEVHDSEGKLARKTVNAEVIERDLYTDAVLTNGFSASASGSVKIGKQGLNGNVYVLEATGGELAEDLKLTRTYTLTTGTEYTFKYYFTSNVAGDIVISADGMAFTTGKVSEGENVVEFKYTAPNVGGAVGTGSSVIELWLGKIANNLNLTLTKSETVLPSQDGLFEKLENFNFNGKIYDRFDGTSGSVGTVDDGKGAYVEVTSASADTWRGGMFVNLGLSTKAGEKYIVSYDIEAQNNGHFEVILQKDQWNEVKINTQTTTGHHEFEIEINGGNSGALWLYVASGANVNKITIKNFSLKQRGGGTASEFYAVNGVECEEGGEAKCENGIITYKITSFGSEWGNNELRTPAFELSSATGNLVISFKAKASAPVSFVFVANTATGWNTFAWKQMKLSTTEQIYSVKCDDKSADGAYKFLWQFGSLANAVYGDVTVEISDIKICYFSELEG